VWSHAQRRAETASKETKGLSINACTRNNETHLNWNLTGEEECMNVGGGRPALNAMMGRYV